MKDNLTILNDSTEIWYRLESFNIEILNEKTIYTFKAKKNITSIGIYPSTLDNRLKYEPYFKIIGGPNNKYVCRVSLSDCKYEYHNNRYDHRINAFLSQEEAIVLNQIMYAPIKINVEGEECKSLWEALFKMLIYLYPEYKDKYESMMSSTTIDYSKLAVEPDKLKKISYDSKTGYFFK